MNIFSPQPPQRQRIYDPLFVVMLIAVVLAVGGSLALRFALVGIGPQSAKASEVIDSDSSVPSHARHVANNLDP